MEWDDIFGPQAERHLRPTRSEAQLLLETASETEPPVSFIAAHMQLSCPGSLRGVDAEGVTVELPNPPADTIHLGAKAAVRFPLAGGSAGFTARVTAVHAQDGGGLRLTMSLPETVRTDEQRAAVRLSVPPDTLAVALLVDEVPVPVRPIDISMTGMGIEVPEGTPLRLALGHRRLAVLKLGTRKTLLQVEVRRQDGPRFGLGFVLDAAATAPLTRMVAALQYRSTAD